MKMRVLILLSVVAGLAMAGVPMEDENALVDPPQDQVEEVMGEVAPSPKPKGAKKGARERGGAPKERPTRKGAEKTAEQKAADEEKKRQQRAAIEQRRTEHENMKCERDMTESPNCILDMDTYRMRTANDPEFTPPDCSSWRDNLPSEEDRRRRLKENKARGQGGQGAKGAKGAGKGNRPAEGSKPNDDMGNAPDNEDGADKKARGGGNKSKPARDKPSKEPREKPVKDERPMREKRPNDDAWARRKSEIASKIACMEAGVGCRLHKRKVSKRDREAAIQNGESPWECRWEAWGAKHDNKKARRGAGEAPKGKKGSGPKGEGED